MTWEPEEKKLCNGEAFSLRYASGELPKRADVIELKSGPDGRDRRVAHVAADGTITVRIDGEGTYEPLDPAGYRLLDGRTVAETIRDARSALERLEGIAERYDERIAGDDTTSPGYSVRVAP